MKKRYFNFDAQLDLVGGPMGGKKENAPKARAIRRDISDFQLGVTEIADICRNNHIFPYDLLPSNTALADQVIDELVRQREARVAKWTAFERGK